MLGLVLLIFAFVCAVLATWSSFGWPAWKFNLVAAALAFYFAALIFGHAASTGLLH